MAASAARVAQARARRQLKCGGDGRGRGRGRRAQRAQRTQRQSLVDERGDEGAPYRQIQCVALDLSTDPEGCLDRNDGNDDMSARVALLERLLEQAAAEKAIDEDGKTLKVFMAPEYLFARHVRNPSGLVCTLESLREKLVALVSAPKWLDWIFVFGTAVGYTRLKVPKKLLGGGLQHHEVFNVALVHRGGHGGEQEMMSGSASLLVAKRLKGGFDFTLGDPAFGSIEAAADSINAERDGVFNLSGITFGLEICMDHSMCNLKRSLQFRKDVSQVQVQLIPSAGMAIKRDAVCVQEGGLIFRSDGLYEGGAGAVAARSEVRTRSARSAADGSTALAEGSGVAPLSCLDALGDDWQDDLAGFYALHHRPKISVYPTLALPPAAAA